MSERYKPALHICPNPAIAAGASALRLFPATSFLVVRTMEGPYGNSSSIL